MKTTKITIIILLATFLSIKTSAAADRTSCVTFEGYQGVGSAQSCWTVINDRIELDFYNATNRIDFCCSNIALVQGTNQISVKGEYYAPNIAYATLHVYDSWYPVPIEDCGGYSPPKSGENVAWIDNFPPSFNVNNSFIIYYQGVNGRITINLPVPTTTTTSVLVTTTTTTSIKDPCPAKTSLGDDSEKLQALYDLRDNVLSKSFIGRSMINLYYKTGPAICRAINTSPRFNAFYKSSLEWIIARTPATLLQQKPDSM